MKVFTALAAAALAITAYAAPRPPISFMPVSEIRPGMTGVGRTVFAGTERSEFKARILGVLRNVMAPKRDLILARLEGGPLAETGVLEGMSGSPVYIDGKLLGAIGYGWPNMRQAIGGITPIADMLEVYEQTSAAPVKSQGGPGAAGASLGFGAGSSGGAGEAPSLGALKIPKNMLDRLPASAEGITLEPLGTPLMVSALTPASMRALADAFGPYGFQIVTAASGRGAEGETVDPDEVGPGYAVGVPYVRGDIEMSALGTISYRKGDKIVAFGHPMMHKGEVDLPMSVGKVHTILPSRTLPFKLFSSLNVIGSVRQDRLSAIGGVLGPSTPMTPVTVRALAPDRDIDRTYRYRVLGNRDFLPLLTGIVLTESIETVSKARGGASVDIRYRMSLSDGTVIDKSDFISGESVIMPLMFGVAGDAMAILLNPFKEIGIDRIEIETTLTDRQLQAHLISLKPTRSIYKPGDTVVLAVGYLPWREEARTATVEVKLPDPLADGQYEIALYDSRSREGLEMRRAPGKTRPLDFHQFLELARRSFPANRTYLTLEARESGLTVRGQEAPTLPPSVLSAIDASCGGDTQPTGIAILAEVERKWPYELFGSLRATVTVNQLGLRK